MNEIDDIKRRAGLTVSEDSSNDPEVLVNGVGKYRLSQVEDNVRRKIADMAQKVQQAGNKDSWGQVLWMLNHAAMQEMVKTIVSTHQEMEGNEDEF